MKISKFIIVINQSQIFQDFFLFLQLINRSRRIDTTFNTNNLEQLNTFLKNITADKEPVNLYIPIEYILSQQGKRLRPQMVYLGTELFNGDMERALYPAAAFELLHNFTLIHDDIMDKAPLRRGKPTVYKKWNTNIAILSGDALATLALQTILKTPCEKEIVLDISLLLSQTSIEICEGQQYDLDFENTNSVTISDYLSMIRLKTAVMLAGCLKAGAILAETSARNQELIYDLGINMGMAFQLKDDLLDVYADDHLFGKINGGDIKENKKTYLLLRAMEDASPEQLERLRNCFSTEEDNFERKFTTAKQLYEELNIKEKTEGLISKYVDNALNNLRNLTNISESSAAILQDWIIRLSHREK